VKPLDPTRLSARPLHRPARAAVATAVLGLALAGCAPAGQAEASAVGADFQTALRDHDTGTACRLLSDEARHRLESSSGQPCVQALARLDLPTGGVRSLQVWGGNSQVLLDPGVLFLAEFRTGWKVTAAGCRPRQDRPYDCLVAG
jgi:hypothetical protein